MVCTGRSVKPVRKSVLISKDSSSRSSDTAREGSTCRKYLKPKHKCEWNLHHEFDGYLGSPRNPCMRWYSQRFFCSLFSLQIPPMRFWSPEHSTRQPARCCKKKSMSFSHSFQPMFTIQTTHGLIICGSIRIMFFGCNSHIQIRVSIECRWFGMLSRRVNFEPWESWAWVKE